MTSSADDNLDLILPPRQWRAIQHHAATGPMQFRLAITTYHHLGVIEHECTDCYGVWPLPIGAMAGLIEVAVNHRMLQTPELQIDHA